MLWVWVVWVSVTHLKKLKSPLINNKKNICEKKEASNSVKVYCFFISNMNAWRTSVVVVVSLTSSFNSSKHSRWNLLIYSIKCPGQTSMISKKKSSSFSDTSLLACASFLNMKMRRWNKEWKKMRTMREIWGILSTKGD